MVVRLPPSRNDPDYTRVRDHDVEELWDQIKAPHVSASYASRLSLMTSLILDRLPGGGSILDVGCAQGTLGLLLASRGYDVTLLDIRAGHIAYAKERHRRGNVTFVVGQLGQTRFAAPFDLVIFSEVLEHLRTPSLVLGEMHRHLKREGLLLLTTPNADYGFAREPSFGTARQSIIDSAEDSSADGDAHRYLFSQAELVSVLRGSGFRINQLGFFLPFWLAGHLKTRHLYRLLGRRRTLGVGLPDIVGTGLAARVLCAAQYAVATSALAGTSS